jgi:HAD superfamily hydrolase (TIGR01549 family)
LIKGIIFDLGDTLIHATGDPDDAVDQGATAMADWYLKKKHIKLDAATLVETFLAGRAARATKVAHTHTEVLEQETLTRSLKKINAPASALAFVEAAVKIFYEPLEGAFEPYPDAVDTLKQLKAQGYRLGLISNAADDALVQRLVNRNRLRPLLSPTFSSAGLGQRKPKPAPFTLIAERWGESPTAIAVVGNTLAEDILGAQNAGMRSILLTMDEAPSNAGHRHIQPTAIASRLSDLPDVVARLS